MSIVLFRTKDLFILLFNSLFFVGFFSFFRLQLVILFIFVWPARPVILAFGVKHWIQLTGSKIHVGRRLVQIRFDLPSGKIRRRVVEWTAGWYVDLARDQRKLWNMRMMVIIIIIGKLGLIAKDWESETGRFGNRRTNQYHQDYNKGKISLTIEKSPRDWRKFYITQTLVKDHLLTP